MSNRKLKKIIKQLKGSSKMHKTQANTLEKMSRREKLQEDLRKWVKEKWVDIGAPKKGGGFKPCGRSEGEKRSGYPKCVPSAKASSMSKKARKSAVRRKRAAGNTGPKPKNVKTDMNEGKLCPKGKAAAKRKFDVYPSAYANMYASAVCSGKVKPGGKKKNESVYHTIGKLIAEKKGRCWKGYKAKKGSTPYAKGSCVKVSEAKSPAWQRKAGKNPEGGLNKKGVASYRAANPGSKLKTAVTTKPSKLKKGSKSANRRKSFCARMGGMKKRLTGAKTANDPNSRINKALRKWNC